MPSHLTTGFQEKAEEWVGVFLRLGGGTVFAKISGILLRVRIALRAGVPGVLCISQGPPTSLNYSVS